MRGKELEISPSYPISYKNMVLENQGRWREARGRALKRTFQLIELSNSLSRTIYEETLRLLPVTEDARQTIRQTHPLAICEIGLGPDDRIRKELFVPICTPTTKSDKIPRNVSALNEPYEDLETLAKSGSMWLGEIVVSELAVQIAKKMGIKTKNRPLSFFAKHLPPNTRFKEPPLNKLPALADIADGVISDEELFTSLQSLYFTGDLTQTEILLLRRGYQGFAEFLIDIGRKTGARPYSSPYTSALHRLHPTDRYGGYLCGCGVIWFFSLSPLLDSAVLGAAATGFMTNKHAISSLLEAPQVPPYIIPLLVGQTALFTYLAGDLVIRDIKNLAFFATEALVHEHLHYFSEDINRLGWLKTTWEPFNER